MDGGFLLAGAKNDFDESMYALHVYTVHAYFLFPLVINQLNYR